MRITVKEKKTAANMGQRTPATLKNYFMVVDADEKFSQLVKFLKDHGKEKILLFFSTCACVDYFSKCLQIILKRMEVLAIHSKMKQKRNKVFGKYRSMSRSV
nr:hypothetical protein BaRGS_015401 [Batillaria attramentaria]